MRGSDAAGLAVMMGVHVDKSGNDCFAFGVDHAINTGGWASANARDATSLGDDGAAFDDVAILERDDAGVGQGDGALGNGTRDAEVNLRRIGFCRIGVVDEVFVGVAVLKGCGVAPAGIHAAVEAGRLDGEDRRFAIEVNRLLAGHIEGQWSDVDVVAFLIGN